MCEDGIVGKHSSPSFGSVGQEVKTCRDKAISVAFTARAEGQYVNEHYYGFVPLRKARIRLAPEKKRVCV